MRVQYNKIPGPVQPGRGFRFSPLLKGVALGQGPAAIARAVRGALGGNLARALTICRTETLRAYREASRRSYEANADVVDGWVWNCACTARSCAMCWAMHGSVHRLDEILDDHPNGRCSMLPHVKELPGLGAQALPESGPAQFAKLEPAAQDAIVGQAAGRAYRAGAIKLEDVVGRTFDPDWGPGRRVRSLSEIVGQEEAKKWAQVARHGLAAHQALGADLNTLLRLRETRLAELRETSSAEIESVLHGMQAARRLPKLDYHFEQHGAELGAATPDELNTLFLAHIRRQDLRFATAMRGKDGARMWFLVDVDSGLVAQYNATRRRYFSFFRVQDLEQFERNYALSWVEAIRRDEQWAFQPWLS